MNNSLVVPTYDKAGCKTGEQEVSLHSISKVISAEQLGSLIIDALNSTTSSVKDGAEVGKKVCTSHRTLQNMFVNFALSSLREIGKTEEEWTDARNETAVRNCKKIAELLSKDELVFGQTI